MAREKRNLTNILLFVLIILVVIIGIVIVKAIDYSRFKNERMTSFIEEIRKQLQKIDNKLKDSEFQNTASLQEPLLNDEQPYTFIFCPDSLIGINTRYENIRLLLKYPIVSDDIM